MKPNFAKKIHFKNPNQIFENFEILHNTWGQGKKMRYSKKFCIYILVRRFVYLYKVYGFMINYFGRFLRVEK